MDLHDMSSERQTQESGKGKLHVVPNRNRT